MQHPLKKLLTPEEVAVVVKFLLEAPQQVNGVKMPVNAAEIIM
jgi:NADP-dependent 3-hydroxy acid dehydrogenase YdfG